MLLQHEVSRVRGVVRRFVAQGWLFMLWVPGLRWDPRYFPPSVVLFRFFSVVLPLLPLIRGFGFVIFLVLRSLFFFFFFLLAVDLSVRLVAVGGWGIQGTQQSCNTASEQSARHRNRNDNPQREGK